jgi:hypothetical protein
MQLPQISCGGSQAGKVAQSGSLQSTRPSPSLSTPSSQTSGVQCDRLSQTPPVQLSVVQGLPSSHCAAVVQGRQPGIVLIAQLPSALQTS